jgi:hypothetical protein
MIAIDRRIKTATLFRMPEKKTMGKIVLKNPVNSCQNEYDCSMDQMTTILNKTAAILPTNNFMMLLVYIFLLRLE